jgi:hypothetical protein
MPGFIKDAALDFEAADEMVIGSLWMPTLTVTSWSRSAFVRLMTIDTLSERIPLISSYDLKHQQDGTKRKK